MLLEGFGLAESSISEDTFDSVAFHLQFLDWKNTKVTLYSPDLGDGTTTRNRKQEVTGGNTNESLKIASWLGKPPRHELPRSYRPFGPRAGDPPYSHAEINAGPMPESSWFMPD